MSRSSWDQRYASGDLPWDTGTPDPHLVEFASTFDKEGATVLEIGCGTGTNAVYLAECGHDVVGVDIAPTAVALAREKAKKLGVLDRSSGHSGRCRFESLDILDSEIPGGPFDLVFDRGCFHTFDDDHSRTRFAAAVAAHLVDGGVWLSLIGSTEGAPRDHGPPRRSARDITAAVEPVLEIVELRDSHFHGADRPERAWVCLSRARRTPAQPSTRRD